MQIKDHLFSEDKMTMVDTCLADLAGMDYPAYD